VDEHKAGTTLSRRELLTRGALLGVGASLAGPGLVDQALAAVAGGTKPPGSGRGRAPATTPGVRRCRKAVRQGRCSQRCPVQVLPVRRLLHEVQDCRAGGRVPDMLEMEWSGNYHAAVDAGTLRDLTQDIQKGFPKFYALPWRRCATRTRSTASRWTEHPDRGV